MGSGLAEWLHAEAPERRVYERPPLELALCQVRFNTRFGLDDQQVGPFQAALEDDYPNAVRQDEVASIQIESGSGQPSSRQLQHTQWSFGDSSGDWTVTLTHDFVALETRRYEEFGDFLDRLRRVLDALGETIAPRVARRVGLRYIDEIASPRRAWAEIITRPLLGVLDLESFRANCEQSVQMLSLRSGPARVNLQHGAFPAGTTVEPRPGTPPRSEPFYLLDVDVYEAFDPPQTLAMNPEVISERVNAYHAIISDLFRWATTDTYRASLGVRTNGR